jgi:hypothetical protein
MIRYYSAESFDATNFESEKIDPRKIKVEYPSCKREFAALCSKNTKADGYANLGCPDYDEWATKYVTSCGKCKHEFKFGIGE